MGSLDAHSQIRRPYNGFAQGERNDLENYIGVNEGRVINFKGKLIKPIVTNKFGIFEKSLIIDKKIHKINESADIRKILNLL